MKTEYQYIIISELEVAPGRSTKKYAVQTKNGIWLGAIGWYSRWRQYTFAPEPGSIFSSGCMVDVCDFIKQLMDARKK